MTRPSKSAVTRWCFRGKRSSNGVCVYSAHSYPEGVEKNVVSMAALRHHHITYNNKRPVPRYWSRLPINTQELLSQLAFRLELATYRS